MRRIEFNILVRFLIRDDEKQESGQLRKLGAKERFGERLKAAVKLLQSRVTH